MIWGVMMRLVMIVIGIRWSCQVFRFVSFRFSFIRFSQ